MLALLLGSPFEHPQAHHGHEGDDEAQEKRPPEPAMEILPKENEAARDFGSLCAQVRVVELFDIARDGEHGFTARENLPAEESAAAHDLLVEGPPVIIQPGIESVHPRRCARRSTSEPARFCSWHHDGSIDWPAEYRAWAKKTQYAPPAATTRHASVFRIANPPDGATYLIDPTLRAQCQTHRLRADAASRVSWRVNDRPVASAEWPLVPGRHIITATDDKGRKDSVRILVK